MKPITISRLSTRSTYEPGGDRQLPSLERAEDVLPDDPRRAVGAQEPGRRDGDPGVDLPAAARTRQRRDPRSNVGRAGGDRLLQQRRIEGFAREDPQELGSRARERHPGARAARFEGDGIDDLTVPGLDRAPDEFQGPPGDAAAAGLFPRMTAVDQGHARARPRQVAGGHGTRRPGPGHDGVERLHRHLQGIATKYGDEAS